MKKLLYFIIFLLVLIGGVLFALYDNSGDDNMPTDLYVVETEALTMLFTELNTKITDVEDGTSADLVLDINQDIINRAIYEELVKQNPSYKPGPDCASDEECYVFSESQDVEGTNLGFRLIGAWVTLHGPATSTDLGKFVLHVYGGFQVGSFEYKTEFEAHFKFEDNDNSYFIEFDRFMVGKVPLPKKMFTTVIGILENQANLDVESQLEDIPFGDVDLETLSYTLEKSDILKEVENSDSSTGNQLTAEMLSIIFANKLIEFDLQDESFQLTAAVSQFKSDDTSDIPTYLYDLHDKTIVDGVEVIGEYNPELFDQNMYLQDVFTEYLFNNALLGGGFEINEETFNKLLYANMDGFSDVRKTQEIALSEGGTKEIELGLKAIWFEFEEDDIFAHALFKIAEIDSLLQITAHKDATLSDGNQLYFEFTEITFGKDAGEATTEYLEIVDLEAFKSLFADLGDVQFGEFNDQGDLVISAARLSTMLQDGSVAGAIEVSGITLQQDALVLDVEATDQTLQNTLDAFMTEMESVLGDETLITNLTSILDETDGGVEQAVYDALDELQDTLTNPAETVDAEQVSELMESIENLDTATQVEVLDAIGDLVDDSIYTQFTSGFGDFSEYEGTTTE